MKIISHYLNGIEGIEIFPLIGFVIFFSFFLVLLFYVYKMDNIFVKEMGDQPFDNEMNDNDSKLI